MNITVSRTVTIKKHTRNDHTHRSQRAKELSEQKKPEPESEQFE